MTKVFLISLFTSLLIGSKLHGQSAGELLFTNGERLFYEGKYDSSIVIFKEAKSLFEKNDNYIGVVKTDYAIGESKSNLNDCKAAIDLIDKGLSDSKSRFGEMNEQTANGYYYLARAYGGCARNFDKAISLLQKSISIKENLFGSDSEEVSYDFTFLGYCFDSKTLYDSATHYLDRALAIRKKSKVDPVELSHTIYYKAKVFESKGDLKNALRLNHDAIKLRMENLDANHPTISNSLNSLGNVYRKYGNFDLALSYYQEGLEIRKRTLGEDHPNVAGSYYTIGNLYGNLFNYHRAIQYIEQGNRIYLEKYGEKAAILHTYLAYIGSLYAKTNNYKEAERYLHKAEYLSNQYLTKNHPYRAIVYNMLGDYYASREMDSLQIHYFKEAQRIYQISYGENSIKEADILVKLGVMHARQQQNDQAMDCLMRSKEIYESTLGVKNSKMAELYIKLGDIYLQKKALDQALMSYYQAANAIALNEVQNGDALPEINVLINKPLTLETSKSIANVYYLQFMASKDQQSLTKSMQLYRYAIELVDEIISGYYLDVSKSRLQKESRAIYEQALRVSYELYKLTKENRYKEEGFLISEKSKSMLLLSNIRDEEAKRFAGIPDEITNKERDLQIEINYHKKMARDAKINSNDASFTDHQKLLFETQQDYEKLKILLKKEYPDYYNFNFNQYDISVSKIQKELSSKTAIIEYFESNSAIYAFILTPSLFEFFKINPGSNFSQITSNYTRSLTNQSLIIESPSLADSLYCSSAFQLYQSLISPALLMAPEVDQLIIVPDNHLSQINFGTLLMEYTPPTDVQYANLSYLIRKYDLSYAYSSTWKSSLSISNSELSFGGFAPSYAADNYLLTDSVAHPMTYQLVRGGNLPLPGAISEVEAISLLMGGDQWTHEEASETNFKSSALKYNIIHLAMHSLLNTEDPEYSELLFNSESDTLNDGFLYINEIYHLKLKADLVVLSACNSGFGKIQVGEGPISISRAFSYAGCPSVVMSMWKIPDEATKSIMVEFYKNLKEGLPKNKSLQLAQLHYLNQTDDPLLQHPFYWASFLAMGDTQPLLSTSTNWSKIIFYIGLLTLVAVIILRNKIQNITHQSGE